MTAKQLINGKSVWTVTRFCLHNREWRAAPIWSLHEAAGAAGLSYRTILRFENDHRDIQPDLITALRRAFEATGGSIHCRGR